MHRAKGQGRNLTRPDPVRWGRTESASPSGEDAARRVAKNSVKLNRAFFTATPCCETGKQTVRTKTSLNHPGLPQPGSEPPTNDRVLYNRGYWYIQPKNTSMANHQINTSNTSHQTNTGQRSGVTQPPTTPHRHQCANPSPWSERERYEKEKRKLRCNRYVPKN